MSKAAYAKRAEATSKIENFWPLVIEQAPTEVDQYIQSQDSQILGEHLVNVSVTRPEIVDEATGNPRSLHFKFEFSPNDYFTDTSLEKTFWYRRARDGFVGLVSEPVEVHWRKGKDLTQGLNTLAVRLWEARKKAGDMRSTKLKEYAELEKKVESWNGRNTSFFTWFGWISGRRWVSAEESEAAVAAHRDRKEQKKRGRGAQDGDLAEEENDDDEEAESDQAVEVHENGEDLAISIADDLWPSAIKLFTDAQEMDDLSDAEFEEGGDEQDSDAEVQTDAPIDIRSLVQDANGKGKGRKVAKDDTERPTKKIKR